MCSGDKCGKFLHNTCFKSIHAIFDDSIIISGQFRVLKDILVGRKHTYKLVIVLDAHGKFLIVYLEISN